VYAIVMNCLNIINPMSDQFNQQ